MARPRTLGPVVLSKDVTIDAGNITASTALDVSTAVAGIKANFPVIVWAESLTANVTISNAHCTTAGTLVFRLGNLTTSDINPASLTYKVVQF